MKVDVPGNFRYPVDRSVFIRSDLICLCCAMVDDPACGAAAGGFCIRRTPGKGADHSGVHVFADLVFTFSNLAALLNYGGNLCHKLFNEHLSAGRDGILFWNGRLNLIVQPAVQALFSPVMGAPFHRIPPLQTGQRGMGFRAPHWVCFILYRTIRCCGVFFSTLTIACSASLSHAQQQRDYVQLRRSTVQFNSGHDADLWDSHQYGSRCGGNRPLHWGIRPGHGSAGRCHCDDASVLRRILCAYVLGIFLSVEAGHRHKRTAARSKLRRDQ